MSPTPEDIIEEHTAPVRELARALRRLVRTTVSEASEKAYPGWHGIGYRHPEAGYICAVFPETDRVRLGFEYGHALPDPDRLLVAEGRKQVCYVVLQPGEDVPTRGVERLLHAAVHEGIARRS